MLDTMRMVETKPIDGVLSHLVGRFHGSLIRPDRPHALADFKRALRELKGGEK